MRLRNGAKQYLVKWSPSGRVTWLGLEAILNMGAEIAEMWQRCATAALAEAAMVR